MAQMGGKSWAAIGLGVALVLGVGIAANAANSGGHDGPVSAASTPVMSETATTASPAPDVRTETQDEVIAFASTNIDDPARDVGTSAVTTAGQNGVKTKTYRVTYSDGQEVSRELVSETTTQAPIDQVTSVGTRIPAPPQQAPIASPANCDPNYSGACVPVASDVDCTGGSGNGPAYVRGPVQVVGTDIYDLDRDGDGTACE
jgi:hypothetical protein